MILKDEIWGRGKRWNKGFEEEGKDGLRKKDLTVSNCPPFKNVSFNIIINCYIQIEILAIGIYNA